MNQPRRLSIFQRPNSPQAGYIDSEIRPVGVAFNSASAQARIGHGGDRQINAGAFDGQLQSDRRATFAKLSNPRINVSSFTCCHRPVDSLSSRRSAVTSHARADTKRVCTAALLSGISGSLCRFRQKNPHHFRQMQRCKKVAQIRRKRTPVSACEKKARQIII